MGHKVILSHKKMSSLIIFWVPTYATLEVEKDSTNITVMLLATQEMCILYSSIYYVVGYTHTVFEPGALLRM